MIKKWSVMVPFHASVNVTVEAETEEEAIDKGIEEAHAGLCHQCSGKVEIGDWNDSADSEPIELSE